MENQLVLTPEQRVIVAADFKPGEGQGRGNVNAKVMNLISELEGTGVYIKVNSALRALGYQLIDAIHSAGLKVFADLKLFDIGDTLATDGILLRETRPELLTTVCATGTAAMKALKEQLPDTEVLGVTVLTSLTEDDTIDIFGTNIAAAIAGLAITGEEGGLDGLICAPTDVVLIKSVVSRPMTFNTPNIRPKWAMVEGDHQNPKRQMTPGEAIKAGATRVVIGRPITQHKSPREAVLRTIEEIATAT